MDVSAILIIIAIVCFVIAAFADRVRVPVDLLAVGLAFFAASFLV